MNTLRLSALAIAFATTVAIAAPRTITLPAETSALKPSSLPGYAIAQQKCGICHSADYIDYQPPGMKLAQWTAEMKKMKALYGAPLDDREIDALAAYLTIEYGDASTVVSIAPPPPAAAPAALDATALLDANGCLACHASDHKIVGPSFHEVADKYKVDSAAAASVGAHIREGGSGRWGTVPMPPFTTLTNDQVAALAAYVLKQ